MEGNNGSGLRDAVIELLEATPGQTARHLTRGLRNRGFDVDKGRVNALLYRHSDHFRNNGAIPPQWTVAAVREDEFQRAPHRLTDLRLTNWKAFEAADVPVSDVTLIYGENSSGKSSIFQAIMLMGASWGTGDFQLGPAHGWYEHVIHRHDVERPLDLTAAWGSADADDLSLVRMSGVSPDVTGIVEGSCPISSFALAATGRTILLLRDDQNGEGDEHLWNAIDVANNGIHMDAERLRRELVAFASNSAGFPDVENVLSLRTDVQSMHNSTIENVRTVLDGATALFRDLVHIGPYRQVPQRDIELGRAVVDAPWLARLRNEPDLLAEVNEWMVRFEIPYSLEIVPYGHDGIDDLFELTLHRGTEGESVQLIDVGFGVSQLLPIVTQLLGNREKTILLEEPEAHVHPRLQSVLGDLLMTSAQDYGNKVLVETHSEPLLLRLQRRIAEGRIAHQQIGVLHVERNGLSSTVTDVPIKENGQLDYTWPGGFFDDRMDDLIAILDPRPQD